MILWRSSTKILVRKIDSRAGTEFRQHKKGDVGLDLEVWFPEVGAGTELMLEPGRFTRLPTGLQVKVADDTWGCVRPRSSTFFRRGLLVMEGTLDSGYTGDLFVNVFNPNPEPVTIQNGDRLGQLVPIPKFRSVRVCWVERMPETERGNTGFGSTGGIKFIDHELPEGVKIT